MRLTWMVPLALGVSLGLTAGCSKQEEPTAQNPAPQIPGPPGSALPGPPTGTPGGMPTPTALSPAKNAAVLAVGQTVFAKNCAKCHGVAGKTNQPEKPDFTSASWHAGKTDAQLMGYIMTGVPPKMPSFKDKLSAKEMDDVILALRNFAKPAPAPAP